MVGMLCFTRGIWGSARRERQDDSAAAPNFYHEIHRWGRMNYGFIMMEMMDMGGHELVVSHH